MSIDVFNQTNINGSGVRLKGNCVIKIAFLCSIPIWQIKDKLRLKIPIEM